MQYTFEFFYQTIIVEDDFIISYCNLEAYKTIEYANKWLNHRVLLLGPEGSGKSHLAKIFIRNNQGVEINFKNDISSLQRAWVIEDIDYIQEENWLLEKINLAFEDSIALLLTATTLPTFKLKDLQSRINATTKIIIKNPDDDLLKKLLLKYFCNKQLKISDEILEYIFTRTKRNFLYIKNLVNALDKLSLKERREITVPLVREVLITYMPQNLADEMW